MDTEAADEFLSELRVERRYREMSTNERKTSRAFSGRRKTTDAERMKLESNYLRGTIAED